MRRPPSTRFRAVPRLAALLAIIAAIHAEDPIKPVFADEFDHDGAPDPAKWTYEVGRVRNGELQYYTKDRRENARVADGCLIITAIKEAYEGATCTSASLITEDRFAMTYGRIEIRAKLPKGRGTWPAIWMMGKDPKGWPACGELDIMEHVGFDPGKVHFTVHTGAFNHVLHTQQGKSAAIANAYDDFHVYACERDEQSVRFRFDGAEVFAFANDGGGADHWPFDRPMYLLLNLAIGGGWGGQQGVDDALFPAEFRIDYVRAYAK
jgi:beta-glucanase (GH16 family)